jgi:hypothetical protein
LAGCKPDPIQRKGFVHVRFLPLGHPTQFRVDFVPEPADCTRPTT